MQRMIITIPRTYNDGSDVEGEVFQQLERDIVNQFGGYSRIEVAGAWRNAWEVTIYENSFQYEIITLTAYATYEMLKACAKELCTVLNQDCILTTCEQIEADFISK